MLGLLPWVGMTVAARLPQLLVAALPAALPSPPWRQPELPQQPEQLEPWLLFVPVLLLPLLPLARRPWPQPPV